MALKTTRSRTRAALGTDADDTEAAVDVKLEEEMFQCYAHASTEWLLDRKLLEWICSHDSYNLAEAENDTVHLRDEYAGHGDEQSRAIHVNVAADRQNEPGHSGIDSELVRHQAERDRERSSPVQSCVRNDRATHVSIDIEVSFLRAAFARAHGGGGHSGGKSSNKLSQNFTGYYVILNDNNCNETDQRGSKERRRLTSYAVKPIARAHRGDAQVLSTERLGEAINQNDRKTN